MNTNIFLLIAWTIAVSFIFVRISKKRTERKDHITYVNANEFNNLKSKNQLIDVREKSTFKENHIVGARNIPISDLKYAENKIFKNKPVYLYCTTGKTATKAAKLLIEQGYSEIIVMKDSITNYPGKLSTK